MISIDKLEINKASDQVAASFQVVFTAGTTPELEETLDLLLQVISKQGGPHPIFTEESADG
jgi:hypothetical protein